MNILNKLTIKHLTMNKKRTIVSIIGIILSTALMVGIGLICSSLREFLIQDTISTTGSYHANINEVEKAKLESIEKNNNIEKYFYEYGIGYAKYEESDNKYKPYFYIDAVSESFFEELKLTEGRYPKDDTEIILSDHIYEQGHANYKIGDTIVLEYGQRKLNDEAIDLSENVILDNEDTYSFEETFDAIGTKTYTIVGICERSNYESYSSPGFYIFTKANNSYKGKIDLYFIYKNPAKTYDLSQTIYKNLGKDIENGSYQINYNSSLLSLYGVSNYGNINRFISQFLFLFLSIISIACIIVIYNSFAISVMERKKLFGLFSSIGATKAQIRKTVFFEALIVGSIGIVLGVLGAYIGIGTLIVILNHLLEDQLGIPLSLTTYPLFIIIPIIFITLVMIISVFIPARRASKISPIEVIRQNDDIKIKGKKLRTSKLVNYLFGVEGTIALKNIKRNKRKYRITIVSLCISIITFLAFSSYLKFGTMTADDYMGKPDYDVYVYINYNSYNETVKKALDEMLMLKDVEDYVQYEQLLVPIKLIDEQYYTNDNKNYFDSYSLEDGKYINEYVHVIKLDDKTYESYKKKLGLTTNRMIFINKYYVMDYRDNNRKLININLYKDNLSITFCNDKLINDLNNSSDYLENDGYMTKEQYDSICTYNVSNFYMVNDDIYPNLLEDKKYMKDVIIVNSSDFEKIKEVSYQDKENNSIGFMTLIKANDFEKLDELGKTIDNYGTYQNITESQKSQSNSILAVKILFYGFITLVTLIGVTSVFNTISTNINLRKREFAIFRSIGLTPHGFNKMIWFESLFFGLKSLLYGLPIGIVLSYLIALNMNNLVKFEYSLPIEAIVISIIGVFVVVLITMWYSTSKIREENILEAIREENI